MYEHDERIVMTLDAGGTNFVFSAKLSETIEMNLRRSDGLMVFDIVHIITKNLWKEVEEGMKRGGSL